MIALALQAFAAFNLVCSGMEGDKVNGGSPYSMELRVDLERRMWCVDACDVIDRIADLTEAEIFLIRDGENGAESIRFSVDRRNGELENFIRGRENEIVFWRRGNCHRAPFTGFPPDSVYN